MEHTEHLPGLIGQLTAQEIIAVNQAWAGHSGSPFKQADSYVQLTDFNMEMKGAIIPHNSQVQSWANGVVWSQHFEHVHVKEVGLASQPTGIGQGKRN